MRPSRLKCATVAPAPLPSFYPSLPPVGPFLFSPPCFPGRKEVMRRIAHPHKSIPHYCQHQGSMCCKVVPFHILQNCVNIALYSSSLGLSSILINKQIYSVM